MCLTYDRIEGCCFKSLAVFKTIITALDKLHANNIFHSDVRKENMLCPPAGLESNLLDFDLAGTVGENYPSTYNHEGIKECHPNAKSGNPRCRSHDQYSMIYVIRTSIDLQLHNVRMLQNKEHHLRGEQVQYAPLSELLSDLYKQ